MIPAHRTPVLVGIGAATRREEDFERALEPMDLMQEAVDAAGNGSTGKVTTVLASVGVLHQSLIGEACARIARGEVHTTLVAGGDAGYRLLRARISRPAPAPASPAAPKSSNQRQRGRAPA